MENFNYTEFNRKLGVDSSTIFELLVETEVLNAILSRYKVEFTEDDHLIFGTLVK